MGYTKSIVSDIHDRRFEELYRIYVEALPPREQKKRNEIEQLLARPDYRFMVIEDEGKVVSFAIVHLSPSQPIALLEYMATDNQRRNSGLGSHVFQEVTSLAAERTLIVEADSEREADAADLEIRIRRKNFYRRLGCRQIIGLNYILPLPGEGEPPLMDLLAYKNSMPSIVSAPEVESWLIAIYTEVYAQKATDPRLAIMVSPSKAASFTIS